LDHFFWRVDSLDWQDHNPESIRDRVVTQMNAVKKGIILFHDIHPQSAAAAKLMTDYFLKNPSVKAVPVSDLPGLKP
jgi:peptidoglycan/xylan/chitin deacetylase (PgdA/CDA1 family)